MKSHLKKISQFKMAEKLVYISHQQIKPIKILKWKVRKGSSVSIGRVLLLYNFVNGPEQEQHKLKSTQAGIVHKIVAHESSCVKQGEIILELQTCSHPTIMNDMCAECGADLRKEDIVSCASVPMIHAIPDLKVSEELAQKLGKADSDRLIKDRKLVLLVDLDQTLIHTTNDNIPPNIKDVYHFQLNGPHSPWYHTRLRPGTHKFLNNIHDFYELHICTFGSRNYAHTIAMYLDADQKIFSNRILSRDECFDPTSKKANLKALFPCGDNMVCIIDDREDVWSRASNLIHVKPYHFFQHTGDINAPPGLDKHDNDENGGVDFTKFKKNDSDRAKIGSKIDGQNGMNIVPENQLFQETIQQKDENMKSVTSDSEKLLTVEVSVNGNKSMNEIIDKFSDGDIQSEPTENEESEKGQSSDKDTNSTLTSETLSNTKEKPSNNGIIDSSIEKGGELASESKNNENEKPSDINPCKSVTEIDEQIEEKLNKPISENKDDETEKPGYIASDAFSEIQNNLEEKPENDSTSEPTLENIKIEEKLSGNGVVNKLLTENNKKSEEQVTNSIIPTDSKETAEEHNESKPDGSITKEDDSKNMIEIEDPDDYLIYLEEVLKRIHQQFYNEFDMLESGEVPDMKTVIPRVRSNVLRGCHLVFSGLVPTHIKLEQSKAYQVARSLGAVVTTDINENTTHLVAVRPGTAKVNTGRRKKHLKIVTPDWLWCCAERWEHVDERIFPLSKKGSKNRHPPPHCTSPRDFASYQEHEAPAVRKRSPSGRFMDTINPLMSFSRADIADMDKEVKDILDNDSDSSEDDHIEKDEIADFEETAEDTRKRSSSSSSSEESLTGEYPKGYKRKREEEEEEEKEKSILEEYNSSEDEEFPSQKFRRGENVDDVLDFEQEDTQDSIEPQDEVDDGLWNMMGAALEREFLSND
nr:RNA polymerase II subunit A C-terminal domain phosphatase [Leptinotarsa decemlineata]